MKLENQVAIITGSARGIGQETAVNLAKAGAHVVLVDLLETNQTRKIIEKENTHSQILELSIDVKDESAVEEAFKRIYDTFGRIDIVVNNAGTCSRLNLEDMTYEMWERDIDTNLKGTFLFTQKAIYPYMKNQKYGRIINVSSISGIMGGPISYKEGNTDGRSGPAYAASKGGVIALTKWVAKEVGHLDITVNSVAPGPVETEITKGMNYSVGQQAIQRMGTPSDIAEAILYFSSPHSGYTTGQVLKVCGGSAIG